MHSLYFFRHQQTARVLVSTVFRMEDSILNQIGEHRVGNKIRGDLWVPFCILTGVKSPETVRRVLSSVTTIHADQRGTYRLPLPEVRKDPFAAPLPKLKNPFAPREGKGKGLKELIERRDPLKPWTVPETVREKIVSLCRVLGTDVTVRKEIEEGIAEADARVEREAEAAAKGLPSEKTANLKSPTYTIHWERDEYRHLAEETGDGVLWPEFVEHKKLQLVRNRWPRIPEFNLRTLEDRPPSRH
ncbi:hypothetical protein DFS34DRAFT_272702 [Phlyctochytrium arcticum]|nr:hypothetical protein DFS34DRAFT_272702 [Phlyctochytrium arcticum]